MKTRTAFLAREYHLEDYAVATLTGDVVVRNDNYRDQPNTAFDQFNIMQKIRFSAILDKRYRPFASGIAAPGRNFIVAFPFHHLSHIDPFFHIT